jgi:hypothetical protein
MGKRRKSKGKARDPVPQPLQEFAASLARDLVKAAIIGTVAAIARSEATRRLATDLRRRAHGLLPARRPR